MHSGKIIQQGNPEEIYRQPVNTYAAGLFGDYNLFPPPKAKILAKILGMKSPGKSMLIRPENFKIITAEGSELAGKVKKVSFFGSFYLLEVALLGLTISVKTEICQCKKGDTVTIGVDSGAVWFV